VTPSPEKRASEKRAFVVSDLGFGDAGKGTVTDFLARRFPVHAVVRFNGGAQAGHNVVTPDGRHHTFAQFGAASFVPGVRTHLSRFMVLHPLALLVEAQRLAAKGVPDALERTTVSAQALVTTPFHQAAGRLRELGRGAGRHGSCGVGVGETVHFALRFPEVAVRAADLGTPGLGRKLEAVRERLAADLGPLLADGRPELATEQRLFKEPGVVAAWIEAISEIVARRMVVPDEHLALILGRPGCVVFEGAQGVLLDEWRGFHPYTTWSTCTFANALALLGESAYEGEVTRIGVLRTYAHRHGAGPFPSAVAALADVLPEPHNPEGAWQGRFRVGWFDLVLARYALAAAEGADMLAVTHLDALGRLRSVQACTRYEVDPTYVEALRLGAFQDLVHQEKLTRVLESARPLYQELALGPDRAAGFVRWIEEALGVPVGLTSSGPTANDKNWVVKVRPEEPPNAPNPPSAPNRPFGAFGALGAFGGSLPVGEREALGRA
jgi:adenylosuccinate synthase